MHTLEARPRVLDSLQLSKGLRQHAKGVDLHATAFSLAFSHAPLVLVSSYSHC